MIAISGHQNQIRKMAEPEQYRFLMIEIPQVARDYGASKDLDESTYKECVKLIINKFNFLAIKEIREAYRQFAIREIEVKGGEMYWGEFNALNLGRVLSEYVFQRKRIIAEYLRVNQEEKEKKDASEKKNTLRFKFENEFPKMLEEAKNVFKEWNDVPAFWYRACMSRGLVDLEKLDANKIFSKAGQLLASEILKENQNVFKSVLDKIDKTEMQKKIARKLAVWVYVLGKDFNSIKVP